MDLDINRKIILIIAGGLLILLGLGIYFLFFKSGEIADNQIMGDDSAFPASENREAPGSSESVFPPLNSPNDSQVINYATSSANEPPDLFLTNSKFRNLVAEPVASAAILPGATSSIVYLDQATGNLHKISFLGEEKERLSFTTIINARQITWGGTYLAPLMILGQEDSLTGLNFSSFKLISDNSATSTAVSTLAQLVGSSTPNNYYAFTSNPNKNKVFSLRRDKDGVSVNVSDFSFTKPEKLASLSFGDWRLKWFKDDLVAMETRPSFSLPGSLYFFNLKTKILDKVLGGINGLTTAVSGDGNYLIYSGLEENKLSTYLYNLKTKEKILLTFSTLADKCVWAKSSKIVFCAVPQNLPRGQYPDSWYKGLISTTDDFWQIEINSLSAKIIAETNRAGGFDVYHPFLDPDGETLFFINKKDLSLWGFDVREEF